MKILNFYFLKLFIGIGLLSCTAFGQERYIDWETTAISPVDTVINGHTLPLSFKWTNHGPDAWQHGDSILYMLIKNINGNEQVVYGGLLYNYYQDLEVGQSAIYGDNYTIMFNHPEITEPTTMDFCVLLFTRGLVAGGDSLVLSYNDTNMTNNYSCRQVVVLPGSTGIEDASLAGTSALLCYPNPATSRVYIDMVQKGDAEISLTDLAGRQVLRKWCKGSEVDEHNRLSLDISHLPEGLYVLTVQTDERVQTEQLRIGR